MTTAEAITKLIGQSEQQQGDINHFLKVWAYARTIGRQEKLDAETQATLEYAAIVHDIACIDLKKRYGRADGKMQEKEGAPMAEVFYRDSGLPEEMIDRICYLVGHHHTVTNVDGPDYRILLEADFLVNAEEMKLKKETIRAARDRIFRTETGIHLLNMLFLPEDTK